MTEKYTIIDLFCGAGGFSCAARKVGLQILAAVENDHHAAETYRYNFVAHKRPRPLLFENDINVLDPRDVVKKIEEKYKTKRVDIVVGGPPCQGFSKHRYKNSGVDDPRNALLLRYFCFIHEISPKFFVVENVGGLLWPRHAKYLSRFYELAKENGYDVEKPIVLNARDYGVPQNRHRVFILGRRTDVKRSEDFQWPPMQTHFSPNSKQVKTHSFPAWNTALQVFEKVADATDPNNIHMHHTQELIDVFASTPKNGGSRFESNRDLPCHKNHKGHNDVYGRICIDTPGPTMTTGCTNPSKGRFLHPFENHGISIREAARFQTFPDDFIFTGGLISASRQVGNAVPVDLAKIVLNIIKKELIAQGDCL